MIAAEKNNLREYKPESTTKKGDHSSAMNGVSHQFIKKKQKKNKTTTTKRKQKNHYNLSTVVSIVSNLYYNHPIFQWLIRFTVKTYRSECFPY